MMLKPITHEDIKTSRLSKLDFRARFTFEELMAITTAAKTDVQVQVLNDSWTAAEFVDCCDLRTIAGVDLLVSKSLLTTDRAAVILSQN